MKRWLFCIVALLLVLSACAQGDATPAPPEIRYGEDMCVECNMIISDARFAAGYAHEVAPGRFESKAFDDIGGMLVHAEKHADDVVVSWYVHDFDSEEWLEATEATFVVSPELPTPMGYGIVAYADAAAAESRAGEVSAMIMSWDELLSDEIGHGH